MVRGAFQKKLVWLYFKDNEVDISKSHQDEGEKNKREMKDLADCLSLLAEPVPGGRTEGREKPTLEVSC